jgi:hypothetical protein
VENLKDGTIEVFDFYDTSKSSIYVAINQITNFNQFLLFSAKKASILYTIPNLGKLGECKPKIPIVPL